MAWETEMTLIVRTLINDLAEPPTYSDSRIQQVIVIAGTYVQEQANLPNYYEINVSAVTITPDPTTPVRDDLFVGLTCLKAACILDQSTYRTKAALEGIRTALGSANLAISGNSAAYRYILEFPGGPCALYEQLLLDWNIGNATAVAAVLSPFVGNTFDPTMVSRNTYGDPSDFYG
jgi:hypothetical protein